MKDILGIPVVEDESVPAGTAFLMPLVPIVVYEPSGGFKSFEQRLAAEQAAIIEAHVQAARRGEISMIKNIK